MKKALSFILIIASIFSIGCYSITVSAITLTPEILRLSGDNRIKTSITISNEGWSASGAKNIVLANGYTYADALAGAPLASALDAPILLTKSDVLEQDLLNQIKVLNCKNIYILGGELSINASVEEELKNIGYNVKRIYGANRYETSIKIADEIAFLTGKAPENVFIASGSTYPDALSISPVAGLSLSPILFAGWDNSLSNEVVDYISNSDVSSIVIVGGENSVSKSVENEIKNSVPKISSVKRVFGASRYETSVEIYKEYSSLFNKENISIATGEDFPDALSGSAFSTKYKLPIILVEKDSVNSVVLDKIISINPKKVYVFGGSTTISENTVQLIIDARPNFIDRTATITSYNCQIYSAPGYENEYLGTAQKGKVYDVLDSADASNGITWFKINTGAIEGWVIRTAVSIENTFTSIEDRIFTDDKKAVIFISPSRQPANLYYNKTTNEQEQMEKVSNSVKNILDSEYDCIAYIAPTELTLQERYEYAYRLDSDIYIAIHSNATGTSSVAYGARMYYFTACNQSKLLAQNLVDSLNAIAPKKSTSDSQLINGMLLLNNIGYGEVRVPADYGMVSLLAETDYHDNSVTGSWIINNTDAIARAYVDGIVKTFNIPKK